MRDYHAIPATSAPSERVFSMAGNLISKKRTRISSENVRYVLFFKKAGGCLILMIIRMRLLLVKMVVKLYKFC